MTIDESFVTASASAIFIALTFKYCKSAINTMVESRIKNISDKLNEALQIKNESENLLKEQRSLFESSKRKSKEILQSAENEITQLKAKAESDLNLQLKIKTDNLLIKIHDQEQKTLSELRLQALILAISGSISILKSYNKNDTLFNLNKEAMDIMSHQFKEIKLI